MVQAIAKNYLSRLLAKQPGLFPRLRAGLLQFFMVLSATIKLLIIPSISIGSLDPSDLENSINP
jgi:hypothetical protein